MINLPIVPGGGRDSDWWEEGRRSKGRGRAKREERDREWGGEESRAGEIACLFCVHAAGSVGRHLLRMRKQAGC